MLLTKIKTSQFTNFVYMACVMFIGFTSYIDALMVVRYRTTILEEQNSIGSFLIKTTGHEGLFLIKMFNTMMVILFAIFILQKWSRAAYLIVAALTIFQLSLMCYIFRE